MTGSPIDGLPWWGKAIFYVVLAPVAAYEFTKEAVISVKEKVIKKK